MKAIRSFFELLERGTFVRTKIRTDVTTFLTMVRIFRILVSVGTPVVVFE